MATNPTNYSDKGSEKLQDNMNGPRRAATQVQNAISELDIEGIRSQIKEVVKMGDEFRRSRPAIFWGAVAGVSALLVLMLFRPSKT